MNRTAIALALLVALPAHGSALSTAADALDPGEWGTLTTTGMNSALGPNGSGEGSNNMQLAESGEMEWYPGTAKLYFYGSDHCDTSVFVTYAESTNTWTKETRPSWAPTSGGGGYCHGMDHGEEAAAIDVANGIFYFKEFSSDNHNYKSHAFDINAGTWSNLPDLPSSYMDPAVPLAYFPEMEALLVFNSGGVGGGALGTTHENIFILDDGTGSWDTVHFTYATANYRNEAHHNRVHGLMLFTMSGYGDMAMWKMDASRTITQLDNAPIGTGIMCPCDGDATIIRDDPNTGDFVVLTNDAELWAYAIDVDVWRLLDDAVPLSIFLNASNNYIFGMAGVNISTHNVFAYPACENAGGGAASCQVSLYKHSAGVAPAAPTGLHIE